MWRVACSIITNTYRRRKVAVTITQKSHATITLAWLRTNLCQHFEFTSEATSFQSQGVASFQSLRKLNSLSQSRGAVQALFAWYFRQCCLALTTMLKFEQVRNF